MVKLLRRISNLRLISTLIRSTQCHQANLGSSENLGSRKPTLAIGLCFYLPFVLSIGAWGCAASLLVSLDLEWEGKHGRTSNRLILAQQVVGAWVPVFEIMEAFSRKQMTHQRFFSQEQ